jgi:hypothetical protein
MVSHHNLKGINIMIYEDFVIIINSLIEKQNFETTNFSIIKKENNISLVSETNILTINNGNLFFDDKSLINLIFDFYKKIKLNNLFLIQKTISLIRCQEIQDSILISEDDNGDSEYMNDNSCQMYINLNEWYHLFSKTKIEKH